jgi:trk system potassium uptake protein TrkH
VDESTVKSVSVFFLSVLRVHDHLRLPDCILDDFSFASTVSGVIACLSNIGPGLESVGPMGNYAGFSDLSKITFSFCMLIGRLEFFPVLILFSRNAWRRR